MKYNWDKCTEYNYQTWVKMEEIVAIIPPHSGVFFFFFFYEVFLCVCANFKKYTFTIIENGLMCSAHKFC